MKHDMYLILPSGSSESYFPDNTCSNYTTMLAKSIDLGDNRYEVGLKEIIFSKEFDQLQLSREYRRIPLIWNGQTIKVLFLSHRFYTRPIEFLEDFTTQMVRTMKEYDVAGNRFPRLKTSSAGVVILEIGQLKIDEVTAPLYINIHPDLQHLLGFTNILEMQQRAIHHKETVIVGGKSSYDSRLVPRMFYVYCDIVQETHLGDIMGQILRVCEIPTGIPMGSVVRLTYENPLYLPVKLSHFSTIYLSLRLDDGSFVPFGHCRTVVTLHIRPKQT